MRSFFKQLFCFHKDWIKRDVIVARPVATLNLLMDYAFDVGRDRKDIQLLTQGTTTIIYECPKCGKIKEVVAIGVPPNETTSSNPF